MGVIQCAVEHCSAPVSCKGWCRAHYRRWQRWGDPLGGRSGPRLCSIDGCDEKHYGLGWCSAHYAAARRKSSERVTALRGYWASRTHCDYGHELSGDNLIIRPEGSRRCRECKRLHAIEYRRRKAAA